jgi:hypothetical protein
LLCHQALLPVRFLLPLSSKHSQEWLCYATFTANCLAADCTVGMFPYRLLWAVLVRRGLFFGVLNAPSSLKTAAHMASINKEINRNAGVI